MPLGTDSRSIRTAALVTELLAHVDVADDSPDRFVENIAAAQAALASSGVSLSLEAGGGYGTSGRAVGFTLAEQIAELAGSLVTGSSADDDDETGRSSPNKQQIAASTHDNFMQQFNLLQSQQIRELEPFLQVLHRVHTDPEVAKALKAKRVHPPTVFGATLTTKSEQDVFSTPVMSRVKPGGPMKLPKTSLLSTPTPLTPWTVKKPSAVWGASSENIDGTPTRPGNSTSTFLDGTTLLQMGQPTQINAPLRSRARKADVPKDYGFKSPELSNLTLQQQEAVVIEDMLYVLMGIDGVYIGAGSQTLDQEDSNYGQYRVDESMDLGLRELVKRILPMIDHYKIVSDFVDTHNALEYGGVNNALCAAMRLIIKEYLVLIGQLEREAWMLTSKNRFTVQKLWYHLQPSKETMACLAGLIVAISNAEKLSAEDGQDPILADRSSSGISRGGGVVLSVICERMLRNAGDPVHRKVCSFLLSKAVLPYFTMLRRWIHSGEIEDRNFEFMIQERRISKEKLREDFSDMYWDSRYTIREDVVPSFLNSFKEKILLSGKYLNVIRECGARDKKYNWRNAITAPGAQGEVGGLAGRELEPQLDEGFKLVIPTEGVAGEIMKSVDGNSIVREIESAYRFSNRKLLDLLMKDHQLMARLRTMKRFFFLYQSDFLNPFLDLVRKELVKPSRDISIDKLRRSFEAVIRSSTSLSGSDPFCDDVVVELSPMSLFSQLGHIISQTGVDTKQHLQKRRGQQAGLVLATGIAPGDVSYGGPTQTSAATAARAYGFQIGAADSSTSRSEFPDPTASPDLQPAVLTGFEALTLSFTVKFPLTLIINKKALTKYQLLFRHIFNCKNIEMLLSLAWRDQGKSRGYLSSTQRFAPSTPVPRRPASVASMNSGRASLYASSSSSGFSIRSIGLSPEELAELEEQSIFMGRMCALRSRMLCFVQQFMFFTFFEVFEPAWGKMEAKIASVATVDQVLQYHNDFLDTCLKECMLTNPALLQTFQKITTVCLAFCEFSGWYTRLMSYPAAEKVQGFVSRRSRVTQPVQDDFELSLESWWDADPNKMGASIGGLGSSAASAEYRVSAASVVTVDTRRETMDRLEKAFNDHIRKFLNQLIYYSVTEAPGLVDLVTMIDYNKFYQFSDIRQGGTGSLGLM
ncbi:Spc98 family-domain-containing protein [Cladochytrium replicatum]|nr:Spc98 family-domain-containing protein [Cladochytrium replicatum]